MKNIIVLSALLLHCGNIFAAERFEFKPEMLGEALDGITYLAKNCESMMSSALYVNAIEIKDARNTKELNAARNKQSNIYDDAKKCMLTHKSRILKIAPFVLEEMQKKGLGEIAKDYIVQAQSTLDATMDERTFPMERSKLISIKNRIDLEATLQKAPP